MHSYLSSCGCGSHGEVCKVSDASNKPSESPDRHRSFSPEDKMERTTISLNPAISSTSTYFLLPARINRFNSRCGARSAGPNRSTGSAAPSPQKTGTAATAAQRQAERGHSLGSFLPPKTSKSTGDLAEVPLDARHWTHVLVHQDSGRDHGGGGGGLGQLRVPFADRRKFAADFRSSPQVCHKRKSGANIS